MRYLTYRQYVVLRLVQAVARWTGRVAVAAILAFLFITAFLAALGKLAR